MQLARIETMHGVWYLENELTTVWLHGSQSSPCHGEPIQRGYKLAVVV